MQQLKFWKFLQIHKHIYRLHTQRKKGKKEGQTETRQGSDGSKAAFMHK